MTAKPEKEKRTNHFIMRLTDSELAKLTAIAESHNMNNANYLRSVVLANDKPVQRVHDLSTIDPTLIRQLANIGNNINQLTRLANTDFKVLGTVDTVTLKKSIDLLSNELSLLREQYTVKK